MKAIIMAGGEGTRLRPLTCDCPKPMVPLMNRPVMEYAVDLLKQHGINRIAVTLGYLPDVISNHFQDGRSFGADIRYYTEKSPLGTAGGVRQASDFLDETFVVLSGDGVTDLDITRAADFHRRNRALATIVLKEVDDPLDYGVVLTDEAGRVQAFFEKPDPSNMFSSFANTGIYILEPEILRRIPPDRPYDFGSDLFPALARAGEAVYGYVTEDYWCDIGDIPAYLRAHEDALNGRIRLNDMPAGPMAQIDPLAVVSPNAFINAPCRIGPHARIASGAYVGAGSVIGRDCAVSRDARIEKCVLLPGAYAGPNTQARRCVLGKNARMMSGSTAFECAVLGDGARLSEGSTLLPQVRVQPGGIVPPEAASGDDRESLHFASPAQAMSLARAYGALAGPGEILLGCSAAASRADWHGVVSGLMLQGVHALDAGICTLPMLRLWQHRLACAGAIYLDRGSIVPLGSHGALLSSRRRRALRARCARQDFPEAFDALPELRPSGLSEAAYIDVLCRDFSACPPALPVVALSSPSGQMLRVAQSVFDRLGIEHRAVLRKKPCKAAPGETGVWLNASGDSVIFSDPSGVLEECESQLLAAWTALNAGERRLLLPVSATRGIDSIARAFHAETEYVAGEPDLWMDRLSRESRFQFTMHTDGLWSALQTFSVLLSNKYTLEDWRRLMPRTSRLSRSVDTGRRDTGRILQAFARSEPQAQLGCGIRFERQNGWAWVCPDEDRRRFRIVTESACAETARELCDLCEKELLRLSGKNPI